MLVYQRKENTFVTADTWVRFPCVQITPSSKRDEAFETPDGWLEVFITSNYLPDITAIGWLEYYLGLPVAISSTEKRG